MLWVALHFANLPRESLEPIAAWACQFTPRVSVEPPREIVLEVAGSLRLFGGGRALLQKLRAGLAELDFPVSLAVAPTARAALWRARAGGEKLETLPLQVTGFETEFFKSIGVASVGQLLALPREGLARRCGQGLIDELDRALGALPEGREFFMPPPRFSAELELPAEVTHAEGLLFAARRLLLQLEGLLAARQAGIRAFTLHLVHGKEASTVVEVGLASPARQAERLLQLLRERLAAVALAQPVQAIRVEATHFTPLNERSLGMFGDAAAEAEGWSRLVERLQARLGRDAVHALTTQPDHRPEHAWRRVEPGEWDPREFKPPGARPLWLTEPRKLAEQDFELLVGPERIEAGWWDGDDAKRDYFIAQSRDSLIWVYREAGEWFCHGIFA
jgi:protein ImuB